ncbi:hypothetical protein HPB47_000722 [Ixodes persulcatus]|uniref:Uncharacterized protein n=1 Tax=Ixodes persulcatus TaxID=34615 RepID=A0AC60PS79_IXOPE|nr:hypothetical protein HPB47_000722 [Ixodes persulcatus]
MDAEEATKKTRKKGWPDETAVIWEEYVAAPAPTYTGHFVSSSSRGGDGGSGGRPALLHATPFNPTKVSLSESRGHRNAVVADRGPPRWVEFLAEREGLLYFWIRWESPKKCAWLGSNAGAEEMLI